MDLGSGVRSIGIIGSGRVAERLARKLVGKMPPETKYCYSRQRIINTFLASDPSSERRKVFNSMGISTTSNNAQVVADSDILFLTVKPEHTISILGSFGEVDLSSKLIVSLIGGVPAQVLENMLGSKAEVLRMVPGDFLESRDFINGKYLNGTASAKDIRSILELVREGVIDCEDNPPVEYLPQSMAQASNVVKSLETHAEATVSCKDEDRLVEEKYALGKQLGSGRFSKVYRAIDTDGQIFAMKVIHTGTYSCEEDLEAEVAALSRIRHDNVVGYYGLHSEGSTHYIVLEHVSGGDLMKSIVESGAYSEPLARTVLSQLLHALVYCHSLGFVHGDVKPHNVLLASHECSVRVKLTDFGFCRKLKNPSDRLHEQVGTAGFVCPEILHGRPYAQPADIWSLGVSTYALVSGSHPFYHPDEAVMESLAKQGSIRFIGGVWERVSPDCVDFIKRMMAHEPDARWTAEQLLEHKWLAGERK